MSCRRRGIASPRAFLPLDKVFQDVTLRLLFRISRLRDNDYVSLYIIGSLAYKTRDEVKRGTESWGQGLLRSLILSSPRHSSAQRRREVGLSGKNNFESPRLALSGSLNGLFGKPDHLCGKRHLRLPTPPDNWGIIGKCTRWCWENSVT